MAIIESNQLLTFKLGSETYGIQISKVREILTYPIVTLLFLKTFNPLF
jgi:chemotaxis signal transduction protein